MIYGLYLSATGVMANSHRQDVIANNLANSETVGFKRDLAMFQERATALRERGQAGDWSDPVQEKIGGGLLVTGTQIDREQGVLDRTGNPFDLGIEGEGYFAVGNGDQTRLTRNGQMMLNREGELILANARNQKVLDTNGRAIRLDPTKNTTMSEDGQISQAGQPVARIGVFDVPDRTQLKQQGGSLFSYPDTNQLRAGTGKLHNEVIERSNVDPTLELTELMDAQRQLEANANMIRYQDSTLQRLVNDVGKIS
jgi:flagellar basal-body rod protein FlgF